MALQGYNVVISAYGAPPEEPQRLPAATAAIVSAMRAAGLDRVITVGGAGGLKVRAGMSLADTKGFPIALLPKVQAHAEAVAVLAASGLHWTCVAPAAQFTPGERTAHYRVAVGTLVSDTDGHSTISYPDFACALLDELEADRHPGQVVGMGN
jgi:putative NADH-flavin reductase